MKRKGGQEEGVYGLCDSQMKPILSTHEGAHKEAQRSAHSFLTITVLREL